MNSEIYQQNYRELYLISDNASWVLDYETRELATIAEKIGIICHIQPSALPATPQCIHYASRYEINNLSKFQKDHRVSFDYYHGMNVKESVFNECYQALLREHSRITRIRVSTSKMKNWILESGIDPFKVFQIPIGINLNYFTQQTSKKKSETRETLSIPQDAFVIGSFQKDGNGWGEGLEPKLIKGPDIFIKTIEQLKVKIPHLWVLLTGPSRGYIKKELEKLNIPYIHHFVKNYTGLADYYMALDLYLISSREEGGPKAVLESMATGIPLVTTKVGQAEDLVIHGQNGWMVEIEDAEGLAYWVIYAREHRKETEKILECGLKTAKENSYLEQKPLWKKFFSGFVEK